MKHLASPRLWRNYRSVPESVRKLADKNFELLKVDPHHPSLHFKKIGPLWSARVGAHYRALGFDSADSVVWFWIGSHADYDKTRVSEGQTPSLWQARV